MPDPYIADTDFSLYVGDVRDVLADLPDESVDCIITSPPYWGLRDYGTGTWEGGDHDCDHLGEAKRTQAGFNERYFGRETTDGWEDKQGELREPFRSVCGKCGARRIDRQLGLEETPQEYVDAMVSVFSEARRVLSRHGTLWLNLGDSYAPNWSSVRGSEGGAGLKDTDRTRWTRIELAPKNLVGIPWRVALALQEDGWFLRSDIIWSKSNPMPESVTDRPTKSHEYVFMLAKTDRYYFDQHAVREPGKDWSSGGPGVGIVETHHYGADNGGNAGLSTLAQRYKDGSQPPGRNVRSVWEIATQPFKGAHFAVFPPELARRMILAGCPEQVCASCGKPRERIVEKGTPELQADTWSATGAAQFNAGTGRYEAGETSSTLKHVVPRETVGWTECECAYDGMKSGDLDLINTPTGERVEDDPSLEVGRAGMSRPRAENEGTRPITRYEQRVYARQLRDSPHRDEMEVEAGVEAFAHYVRTDRSGARPVPPVLLEEWVERGWIEVVVLPDPRAGAYRPGVVLDPFMGSGTTALVAREQNRHAVGIELNPEYADLIASRLAQQSLFA